MEWVYNNVACLYSPFISWHIQNASPPHPLWVKWNIQKLVRDAAVLRSPQRTLCSEPLIWSENMRWIESTPWQQWGAPTSSILTVSWAWHRSQPSLLQRNRKATVQLKAVVVFRTLLHRDTCHPKNGSAQRDVTLGMRRWSAMRNPVQRLWRTKAAKTGIFR